MELIDGSETSAKPQSDGGEIPKRIHKSCRKLVVGECPGTNRLAVGVMTYFVMLNFR